MTNTTTATAFCKSCHKYTVHSTDIFNAASPVSCTLCGTAYTHASAALRQAYAQELRRAHPLTEEPRVPCQGCGLLAASATSPFCSSSCQELAEGISYSEMLIRAIIMSNPEAYREWLAYRVAAFRFFTDRVV